MSREGSSSSSPLLRIQFEDLCLFMCVQSHVPAKPESSLLCMPSSCVGKYTSTLHMGKECMNYAQISVMSLGDTWILKVKKDLFFRFGKQESQDPDTEWDM